MFAILIRNLYRIEVESFASLMNNNGGGGEKKTTKRVEDEMVL